MAFAQTLPSPEGEVLQFVSRVNAAEERRESNIGRMVSTRRYVLRNRRWEKDAVMRVRITSQPNAAKQFEVLELENTGGLQKKVFMRLLEAEIEASGNPKHEVESRVSPENYTFTVVGKDKLNGRECMVLALKPKRSSKYLIAGKAWVDTREHAIVRVEGETAKSLSFWIGKPKILQDFRNVNGVWVSSANKSVSDVRFLGTTELTVDFEHYDMAAAGTRQIAQSSTTSGTRLRTSE